MKGFLLKLCDENRTLTTPVTLDKCLKSIKEHAFVNSPYPVIITLEDHLTPSLQSKVAEVSLIFSFGVYNLNFVSFQRLNDLYMDF